ncbi:MAG: competence/damage-inducible protein A [Planctomycetes bacterium]|nr:competence/damage-inducible protein A [Planctomycetota bacterium]
MDAEIVATGSELVLGRIANTNAAWLSRELEALGFPVRFHTAVGDRRDDLLAALRLAARRARIVLITGGLGPTADDLTRAVVAALLRRPLVRDPAAVEHIRARFAARGLPMTPSNLVQADRPAGTHSVPNPGGTAPGFIARRGRARLIALPGVPREMEVMFRATVAPYLLGLSRRPTAIAVRELLVYGLPESTLGERLGALFRPEGNPAVGTMLRSPTVVVRVRASAATAAAAARRADACARRIRARLGDAVYGEGEGNLEHEVIRLLSARRRTLALAESCTGGLIGHKLTNVPGASAVLLAGTIAYANATKTSALGVPRRLLARHGAVSAPVAEAMARGARRRAGADFAVAVTGIAGPTGGTPEKPVGLVFLAVAGPRGVRVEEHRFPGERGWVKERAAAALNALRLAAAGRV